MQIKMTVRLFFSPKRLANYKKFNNTLLEKLEEDSNIHTNNGNYHWGPAITGKGGNGTTFKKSNLALSVKITNPYTL